MSTKFMQSLIRFQYSIASRCIHDKKQTLLLVEDMVREKVNTGKILYDPIQERVSKRLSKLQLNLHNYCNYEIIAHAEKKSSHNDDSYNCQSESKSEAATTEIHKSITSTTRIPRGFFIYGNVGCGKTMLMDLFYASITTKRKRRVHFHSFMQDVHKRLHDLKKKDLEIYGRNFKIDLDLERNPIYRVGCMIASEVSVLCFDEFQVTDVADALILSQLFSVLFNRGTVIVATSNRSPHMLYDGGLNRSYFMPFIDLLCRHCIVHDMNSTTDYRSNLTHDYQRLIFPFLDKTNSNDSYEKLVKRWNLDEIREQEIRVAFNRVIKVKYWNKNAVRFHFDNLCKQELGSNDYRALAEHFRFVFLDGIPILTLKEHDQARRFITLIDELYEAKCVLICSAAAQNPDDLFFPRKCDTDSSPEYIPTEPSIETKPGESFGIDVAQSDGSTVGEHASIKELSFAFKRAASRMKEMTSTPWLEKHLQMESI